MSAAIKLIDQEPSSSRADFQAASLGEECAVRLRSLADSLAGAIRNYREVLTITVAADLPAHDRATVRIKAHFKAGAAIRFPQLGERGFFGHISVEAMPQAMEGQRAY